MSSNRAVREAALAARPGNPADDGATGTHALGIATGRDGALYLPRRAREVPHPFILLLHGSGADSHTILGILERPSEENQCALLVPDSRQYTWDVLISGFGPDVRFLDHALAYAFDRCLVDPARMAIAGFSDGASYALTLGVSNGALFTHVMAFSPGFIVPPRLVNTPRIFMCHGVRDDVLPIERCSRNIVPQLQEWGYDVTYREFPGGHIVPESLVTEAMKWFLESPKRERA